METNRRIRRRRVRVFPYLLLAPAMLVMGGLLYPLALAVYYSFTNYWLQYPDAFRFVGFTNYADLIGESAFLSAVNFTILFTLVAVALQVGLGLAVALFLHARVPGRQVIRALMLMPLMMPPVITALMWKVMMGATEAGILNYMLSFFGASPINWFGSETSAIMSIMLIDTWGNLPFVALILLGGLQSIPTEPYEAARVDGAPGWAILLHITLPLLSPFLLLVVTFRTMDTLRIFDVIYATTLGGPGEATTNLHIMAYQYAFQWYQMGTGSAVSMVLFVLVMLASFILLKLWNRSHAEGAL